MKRTPPQRHVVTNSTPLSWHDTPPPSIAHPQASISPATSVIIHQVEGFNIGPTGRFSEGYFETHARSVCRGLPKPIPDVLRCLLWHSRYQSCVFEIFMGLCRHGHYALTSPESPVSYTQQLTPLVRRIEGALLLFKPGLHPLCEMGEDHVPGLEDRWTAWQDFEPPLQWLAIMIARSATNFQSAVDFIEKTGYLGAKDPVRVDASLEFPSSATFPDPTASGNAFSPGTT
ncbi:MAG: hypothetical protein L6R37_004325 [Teloschistes peruensis]|nr:MAG: hypothetical protein L6R37_004325 [Teloschistes peruensis]